MAVLDAEHDASAPESGGVPAAPSHWTDRFWHARDRLLASRRFQRWAGSFPLTRSISHRRAGALFDLVAGFAYSQTLLACVRLGLFEFLFERARSLDEVARHTRLEPAAAERLLAAAIALRLVARRHGGRYGLGEIGAPLVGNAAVRALIEHHDAFYADLADPVALLRGRAQPTQLAAWWPYAQATQPRELAAQDVAAYSTLMSASQPLVADDILQAYPLHKHRWLLDVGGGEGCFLASALQSAPQLKGTLFDLPAVVERARSRWSGEAVLSRLQFAGGDFLRDPLPRGPDIVTLVRVVHDHDDAVVLSLLRAVHAALPQEGTLLVAEPMAQTGGAQAMGDAYFGLYLWAMGQGRARTPQALEMLLRSAGFEHVRLRRSPEPLLTRVLVARKT
jgi:demethylspheroidene O-methyltransferase